MTVSSLGVNSYYYTNVKPKTCVDFINKIWSTENKNNKVGKIITTGLQKNISMYFVIESFEYCYKAGEEDDIYYTLELKQYKPYGVTVIKPNNKTKKNSSKKRTTSTSVKKYSTYKVKKGDCLWNIAKAASGNGSNWKELYNLNKKVIGSNPNLIKPGQILNLPEGWKASFKVKKLQAVSKSIKSTTKYRNTSNKSNTKNTSTKKNRNPTMVGRTINKVITPSGLSKLAAKGKITLSPTKKKELKGLIGIKNKKVVIAGGGGGSSW